MSREIKFRAWDKTNKEMFNVARYDFADNTVYRQLFGAGTLGEDCEILEYTGLKDKNGTEVYEGDIVRWNLFYGVEETEGIDSVYFGNGAFRLNWHHILLDYINVGEIEVIGNVWENKELLEKWSDIGLHRDGSILLAYMTTEEAEEFE